MNHPSSEDLIRIADGDEVVPAIVQHVHACAECTRQLGELASFEADVALAAPIAAQQRESMRRAAQHVLASAPSTARSGRRLWFTVVLAAAATVVAMLFAWPRGLSPAKIEVVRYVPPGTVRSGEFERFSLTVQVTDRRWLAVWQVGADERVRLLPTAEPIMRFLGMDMPLAAGSHRVPGSEVLDFEFRPASQPLFLVVVTSTAELTAVELAAIEASLQSTPTEQWIAALTTPQIDVQVVAFPK